MTSNWDEEQTVKVTAVDDNVDNPNNKRTATLSHTASGGDYGSDVTIYSVTVTVTDDDEAVTIDLSVSDSAVAEDVGSAQTIIITAAIEGENRFAEDQTVTVIIGKLDDSAMEGIDYEECPDETITIAAGESSGAVAISLVLTNDYLDEPDEMVNVDGMTTYGIVNGTTLTIMDDDETPETILLTVDTASIAENVAEAQPITVTASIEGESRFGVAQTVAVEVGRSDDSAIEGTDYTSIADLTITIAAGAPSGEGTFTLNPVDDDVDEGEESFSVAGALPGVAVIPTRVTLTDNDTADVVLSVTALEITEASTDREDERGTYSLMLTSAPVADVLVTVKTDDVSVARVLDGHGVPSEEMVLTFTPSTWSVPQSVIVVGVDDRFNNIDDMRLVTIRHTVVSEDAKYDDLAVAAVTVTVLDDDDGLSPAALDFSLAVFAKAVAANTVDVVGSRVGVAGAGARSPVSLREVLRTGATALGWGKWEEGDRVEAERGEPGALGVPVNEESSSQPVVPVRRREMETTADFSGLDRWGQEAWNAEAWRRDPWITEAPQRPGGGLSMLNQRLRAMLVGQTFEWRYKTTRK